MALEYAVSQQKTGYSSIAKIGKHWSEQGIDTLEGAMEYIEEHNSVNEVWNKLRTLTDISNRTPTTKQRGYLVAWVKEYGYDENIIYYAYEESVDRTGKMSMPYMDKIIRSWYEKGVKTPMDIQREKAKWQEERDKKLPQKNMPKKTGVLNDEPSYDISAFTKKAIGLKYKKTTD
jgi:DnaD/phage-associated family protein